MKRIVSVLFILAVLASALAACAPAGETKISEEAPGQKAEKAKVIGTSYVMAYFAREIAGDKLDVQQLLPPGAEAHGWEPTAQDMVSLQDSSLIIANGAGMESWLPSLLESIPGAKDKLVDTSEGLELLAGGGHTHEHEEEHADEHEHEEEHTDEHGHHSHEHGLYDPHTWLSPLQAKAQAENIMRALIRLDHDNEKTYRENFDKLAVRLDELDRKFKEELKSLSHRTLVTNHEAFAYLCHAYDLEQIGITGVYADEEPSPARMAEIIELVKEHGIPCIFTEELLSPKIAEMISESTGARNAELNPIGNITQEQLDAGEDYFTLMEKNLSTLLRELK